MHESKQIKIVIELDYESSQADLKDLRPYIERMTSFSLDSVGKDWEGNTLYLYDANCRKLYVKK
jgi:hypothetical protein